MDKEYLTFTKQIDSTKLTMKELIFWSEHNIYVHINCLYVLTKNKLKYEKEFIE